MLPGPANPVHHQKDLCMQLWQLRTNFTLCDAALKVGGTLLPAHRIVLCACSPVLLIRFTSLNQPVGYCLDLTTEGVSYDVCQSVLEFMYTGVVPNLPKKRLPELDWLVGHWQLTSLQTKLALKYKNKQGASMGKAVMVSTTNKNVAQRGKALAVSTVNPNNLDHPYFKDVYKGKNVAPGESLLRSDILNAAVPLPISSSTDELVEEECCECECEQESHDDGQDECQANSEISSVSGTSGNKIVVKEETDFEEELFFGSNTPSPAIQFQVSSTEYQGLADVENEIYKCLTNSDKEDVKAISCTENDLARGIGRSEACVEPMLNDKLPAQDLHLDSDTQLQASPGDKNEQFVTNSETAKDNREVFSCIAKGSTQSVGEAQSVESDDPADKRRGHLGGNLQPQDLYLDLHAQFQLEEGSSQGIRGSGNAELDNYLKGRSSQCIERPQKQHFQLYDDTLFKMYQDCTVENGKFLINCDTTNQYPNTISYTDMASCIAQAINESVVQTIQPDDHQGESSFSKEDTEPIPCAENGPPQGVHNAQNAMKELTDTEFSSFTHDPQEERRHFDEDLQRQHFQLDGLPELEDIHFSENLMLKDLGYGEKLEVCNTDLSEQPKLQPGVAKYTGEKECDLQNTNKHNDRPTVGNGQEITMAKVERRKNNKTGLHNNNFVQPCLPEETELPSFGVFLEPQVRIDEGLNVQVAESSPFIMPEHLRLAKQNCEPVQFSQAGMAEEQTLKMVQCSQPKGTEFQSRSLLQRTQEKKPTLVLLKIVQHSQTEEPMLQNGNDVQYVLAKDTGLRQSGAILQLEDQTAKHLSHGVVQHAPVADCVPQPGKPIHPLQADTSKLQRRNAVRYTAVQQANITELPNNEATQRLKMEKTMHQGLQHWPAECNKKDLDAEMSKPRRVRFGEYPVTSQTETHSGETVHSRTERKTQCTSKVIPAPLVEEDQEKTTNLLYQQHESQERKHAEQPLHKGNNKAIGMTKKTARLIPQTKLQRVYSLQRSPGKRKTQCICMAPIGFTRLSEDPNKNILFLQERPDLKQAEPLLPDENEWSNIYGFLNSQGEMVQQRHSTTAQSFHTEAPKPQNRLPAQETNTSYRGSSAQVHVEKMTLPTCTVTQYLPDEGTKLNRGKEIPQVKTEMQKVKIDQIGERLLAEIQKRRELQHLQYEEVQHQNTLQKPQCENTGVKSNEAVHFPPTNRNTCELVQGQQHVTKKSRSRVGKRLLMKKTKLQSLHLQPAKKVKLQNVEDVQKSSLEEVKHRKTVVSYKKVAEVQDQNTLQNTGLNEAVHRKQVETGKKPQPAKKVVPIEHLQSEKTNLLSANVLQDLPTTNRRNSKHPRHVTKKQPSRVVERLLMEKMKLQALHLKAVQKLKLQKDEAQMFSLGKVKVDPDEQGHTEVAVSDMKDDNKPEPPTVKTKDYNMSNNPDLQTVKTKGNMCTKPEPPTVEMEDYNTNNNPDLQTVKTKGNMCTKPEPPTVEMEDYNTSNNPDLQTVKMKGNMCTKPEPPTVEMEDYNTSNNPDLQTVKMKGNMCTKPELPTVEMEDYDTSNNPEPLTVKTIHEELYLCTDCLMLFEDHTVLTVHRNSFHIKTEQYTCVVCNLSYDTQTQLQTHVTEHHWREGGEIDLTFNAKTILQARNAECHRQEGIKCELSSSPRYALNKEVCKYSRKEGRKNPVLYYCEHPLCTYKTHNLKILSKHRQLHAVIPAKKRILVTCEECGKSYLNARCLAKHKEQDHKRVKLVAKERLRCTLCTFSSLSRSNLAEHLWKKHDLVKEGKARYKCSFCDFKTLQLAIYKIHKTTHKPGRDKLFVCKVCGKRYHKADGLGRHMTYHTGEAKLYQCPHCDYVAVNNKTTLHTHIQLMHEHKGEKRYPCDGCDYACNYKGNLYKHLRQVHNRNPCLQAQSHKKTKKNTKSCLLQDNTQRKTKKGQKTKSCLKPH